MRELIAALFGALIAIIVLGVTVTVPLTRENDDMRLALREVSTNLDIVTEALGKAILVPRYKVTPHVQARLDKGARYSVAFVFYEDMSAAERAVNEAADVVLIDADLISAARAAEGDAMAPADKQDLQDPATDAEEELAATEGAGRFPAQ